MVIAFGFNLKAEYFSTRKLMPMFLFHLSINHNKRKSERRLICYETRNPDLGKSESYA